MYSLALIIFVGSEKKAFEHFPIGSNVNLCIAVGFPIDIKNINFVDDLPMIIPGQFGFNFIFFMSIGNQTAIHRLTLDPMGKCSNAFFFSETTNT
jgi:hypothetical protein